MSETPGLSKSTPLFRHRPLRLLVTTRVASNTANQMQAVAVGWYVYELTGSALALGLIGLVQFLPPLCLTLPAGQIVDHHSRRLILLSCYAVEASVSLGLLVLATFFAHPVGMVFSLLLVNAIARTFEGPALQSLLPSMAPRGILMGAVSVYASAGKMSQLVGPALGGLLYGLGAGVDFGLCALMIGIAGTATAALPIPPAPAQRPKVTWGTLVAGIHFIWNEPAMLGAMSLDMVATLFGGVVALLPIFARDILHINAWGFGLLRAAPATGALIVAAGLTRLPVRRAAGRIMFTAVAVYGVATIGFGVSNRTVLSLIMLMMVGAGDMLSVVVRQSIMQFATPDEMRGRVFAVNTLFNNCASQIGMFESGVTADWFGAVGSAVLGGAVVLAVVVLWSWYFPTLRRVERPEELAPERYLLATGP
ncbi:MAG TPA: MFS transporter [Xanthobacteraceae bacterium]|nr:MFS transporter [Xanthobacteraceae bacterium]